MGQLISREHNNTSNDGLINTLIKRDFIHTMDVEKVFRSVDRGLYFTNDEKRNAYRDSAWQSDKIHLSAPCVYATVLECLDLKPGNKFLNIGSGIGYFSTLAGLLLGINGVNHGIEIHQLLIDYAHEKIEEFKLKSAAIDYYDFCEPVFIQGNACELLPTGYYDRVYCGAGVPPEEYEFMKSLIKVGGILVMPLEGFLVQVTRRDEHTWKTIEVLEVSFTNLVVPDRCSFNTIKFPPVEPLSLQELCRSNIRTLLRDNLKNICPNLPMRTLCLTNNLPPLKNVNIDNPLDQFVRIQYGVSEEGLITLRNIVESIAGFNNDDDDDDVDDDDDEYSIPDLGPDISSEENNDDEGSDNDDDNNDSDNNGAKKSETNSNHKDLFEELVKHEEEIIANRQNKNTEQASDEPVKRKSPEASGSVQFKTTGTETDAENPKRMKMNKSPRKTLSSPSTSHSISSHSNSDLWETVSTDTNASSMLQEDSNSWVSSLDADQDENVEPRINEIYNTLLNDDSSDESESSSEAARLMKFSFVNERKENELSKLLKVKIDSLPIPTPLKVFLNYNWVN